ncbi:MAG: hypothetical protein AABN95_19535 [Acidobacteriota bacterium]
MSRHEDSFQIALPPEQAKPLIAEAIKSLGPTNTTDLGHGFVSTESFRIGFTWPATIEVLIKYGDAGMSRITINASNLGFGPIQSSHVKGKVLALRQRIEQMTQQGPTTQAQSLSQPAAQSPPPPTSGREVFVNGVRLRDDQVNFLEQKYHSSLPDGYYWYDHIYGGWGVIGGPVLCTLQPNHDIGGPLQPGASNGSTGVFINGRELHYLDTALLQRVVPMIISGRWWLHPNGDFGSEGGPMLGNLWAYAQSQGSSGSENRSSVLASWDCTDVAVFAALINS